MTFAADKARLEELYALAKARGVTMSQWNLAAVDGDLPETIQLMVELMEKSESGDDQEIDPRNILDASR